jgi:hypothetical protein
MSKIIAKLNKLNNPESFIQINTIKGFKYIDKAGEIVNAYHKNNSAPQFKMGLDGLIINGPKDKINELKITSQIVWAKFSQIDSLDMISNLFAKEAEIILKILEIEKVSRVGWRNYFVYEFQDKANQDEYLKKFTVIDNTKPSVLQLEVKTRNDFKANLIIQPVVKNDENKTSGVLFDIDVFQSGEIKRSDVLGILKTFRQYLADEKGFLSLVNNTF